MEATVIISEEESVRIMDDSDREWNTRDNQQLISQNQDGPIPGHYMQVHDQKVLADGQGNSQRTQFKTHTILEPVPGTWQFNQVVILENNNGSVVAIDTENNKVTAKVLNKPPSQYNTLEQVKNDNPEVLFYKMPKSPGSEIFYFKSFLKDMQRILGFDDNGVAMDPTVVQPSHLECQFIMV